jgi:hypothetical protein
MVVRNRHLLRAEAVSRFAGLRARNQGAALG